MLATDLVAGHAVLLHLLKLALELRLSLHLLLRAANVNGLPIHLFAVHLVHSLQQTRKVSLYIKKAVLRTVVINPVLQTMIQPGFLSHQADGAFTWIQLPL